MRRDAVRVAEPGTFGKHAGELLSRLRPQRRGRAGGSALRSGSPQQMAAFAVRSARALSALALLGTGVGGLILLAETVGLVSGSMPDALWLVACGLVAAALAAVSAGLARLAGRLARVAVSADDLLVTVHGRTGDVRAVEHRGAGHPLPPVAALMGVGLFERILVADRPAFLATIAAAASPRAEHGECRCDLRLRCEVAGTTPAFTWMELRAVPAEDGGARAFWRDVSAARAKADQDERARMEAERANHAKSRFLAAMSHELRTPLNAILGFSELLAGDAEGRMDAARRTDYARIIHESGQHLLELVNDILDLSRVEAGAYELQHEMLDVAAVVEGCLEMMRLEAGRRGLALSTTLPARLPVLEADPRAVRQILLNLLSNALKFTPAGGEVALTLRPRAGRLTVFVRDTGPGMSQADVARLGEPFFQAGDAERRRAGSGLGLAVVRALVLLHGGEFKVSSTLGRGTTVMVALPLVQSASVVAPFARQGTNATEAEGGRRSA